MKTRVFLTGTSVASCVDMAVKFACIAASLFLVSACYSPEEMAFDPLEPNLEAPGASAKTPKAASDTPGAPAAGDPGGGPAPKKGPTAPKLPVTPEGEWTYWPPELFDNKVKCMDGSTTGLFINRAPGGSKKLLIFLRGAAACFDGQSCFINEDVLAADRMSESEGLDYLKATGSQSVFNRARTENPFRDYDIVWMPYCSGDVFAGDNENGYQGRVQVGYRNVAAYLPRLASTYADATDVVLSGMSAGAYGATYNFPQVQRAFDEVSDVKVTLINDSGPVFGSTYTPPCLAEKWKETWGMNKTIPLDGHFVIGYDEKTGIAGNGFYDIFQAILDKYPDNKFAFISTQDDLVMRYFHGIGHSANCGLPYILSSGFFRDGLREIREIKNPNFSTFYGPGTAHPYFNEDAPMYDTTVDNITLAAWLTKVVTTRDEPKRVPATF